MNLPNALTLIRVLLIPVFVIFILDKRFEWALVTFAVAGITDGVDGMIARITHQRTELGAYLDPIADKLLVSAAFISLAIVEILPSWLAVIVITRDVFILLGILIMILINHRPKIEPSLLSKVTTTLQIATVLLVLLARDLATFYLFYTIAIYGTTTFTILSGLHYIYTGTRVLNERMGTKGKPR
ncbi:MAG: CDP-diacylglycerol--glycerol-3-phosphate 3-phosphatidyltransferase [Deltaproteobacteria bacterium RBG_13_53_10]|nr:MAG: CDP-diacylglycerol--glycerol-3-phosphate 3-phosphatidyltransferase [Deltaproteobacteria bacterium RBG_13_53_10]